MTLTSELHDIHERLGKDVTLKPAQHWIPGRRGLTCLVTDQKAGRKSIFKRCSRREMVCWRDLLPEAPVSTPALYRWWDSGTGSDAAVEIEYIPHLAVEHPCYRFSPSHVPFRGREWRERRSTELVEQLARMHAWYAAAPRENESHEPLQRSDAAGDLLEWEETMRKLRALSGRPGAAEWMAFWEPRERSYAAVLEDLYRYPLTWIWGDAKWDHVGCRDDGSLVFLEWSTVLGPAGSDLYLLLFEEPSRRQELLVNYAQHAAAPGFPRGEELQQDLRLGLLRACYRHGPGQAVLSLRGCAGTVPAEEDLAAWRADAVTTANALELLETSP